VGGLSLVSLEGYAAIDDASAVEKLDSLWLGSRNGADDLW